MNLKVCGMKYLSNIEALSALDIDYMGFIFYPKSKRYVGEDFEPLVLKNIPDHIEKVAVFVNEPLESIRQIAEKYGFKTIQLHGNEAPEYAGELKTLGYSIIKAFAIDAHFDFNNTIPFQTNCDYFLFDTKSDTFGGTGHAFDWELLEKYMQQKPFFLSGGISLETMDKAKNIGHSQLYAFDINSKFETEPALKNIDLIKEFILQIA